MAEKEVERLRIVERLAYNPCTRRLILEPAELCIVLRIDGNLDGDKHASKCERANDTDDKDGQEQQAWYNEGVHLWTQTDGKWPLFCLNPWSM